MDHRARRLSLFSHYDWIVKSLVLVTSNFGDDDGWASYSSTILTMAKIYFDDVVLLTSKKSTSGIQCLPQPNLRLTNQIRTFFVGLRRIPLKSTVHILVEPYAPAIALASRVKLSRPIMTLHGTYSLINWETPKESLRSLTRLFANALCTKLTSGSQHILDKMPMMIQKKITVIPNAVDLSTFQPVPFNFQKFPNLLHRNIILTVGEVKWRKGQLDLLKLFIDNKNINNNCVLVIVGECSDEIRVKIDSLVRNTNMQDHVFVLGRINQNELISFYSAAICTILWANSNTKNLHGHPMIIHEANACGSPVVISRGATDPHAITEGVSGFWVNEGDSNSVLKILDMLVTMDKWQRSKLRESCIATSRKFSTNAIAPKLANLYQLGEL